MSLDRLINLAKRTGDRLIIHDPVNGRDLVILDIDAYERLIFGGEDSLGNEDNCKEEEDEEIGETDWHSAGSVLSDRYGGVSLVDDMWKETEPTEEEMKSVADDAAQERKETTVPTEPDEPVFYEEPVA